MEGVTQGSTSPGSTRSARAAPSLVPVCPTPRGRPARGGCAAARDAQSRPGARDLLTFSQPVLEVGVTPPLTVKVNAVPDEKSPADPGGNGAVPAHHLLSTEVWGWRWRGSQRPLRRSVRTDVAAHTRRPPGGLPKGRAGATSGPRRPRPSGMSAAMPELRHRCRFCACVPGPGDLCAWAAGVLRSTAHFLKRCWKGCFGAVSVAPGAQRHDRLCVWPTCLCQRRRVSVDQYFVYDSR